MAPSVDRGEGAAATGQNGILILNTIISIAINVILGVYDEKAGHRRYEAVLDDVRVPLNRYCESLGVRLVVGEVGAIDSVARRVVLRKHDEALAYDSLILAAGRRCRHGVYV